MRVEEEVGDLDVGFNVGLVDGRDVRQITDTRNNHNVSRSYCGQLGLRLYSRIAHFSLFESTPGPDPSQRKACRCNLDGL